MRYRLLFPLLFVLTACSVFQQENKAVDPSKLPPLSGQERALLISADSAAAAGDFTSAERNYLTAAAQSKGQVIAHLSLADLYVSQNQPDKAEEILETAAEFQPANPEIARLRGKIALQNEHPAAALQFFNEGLKADPSNVELLTDAGIANDLMHKHAAAQVLYLKAMQLHPDADLAVVKTNLAMSYLLQNKPKLAEKLLKDDAKKPDAPAAMRHNLALAYGVLGKHVLARTTLHGDISEEERLQSLKRLEAHITADDQKNHPAQKNDNKGLQKPPVLTPAQMQPAIRYHHN